MRIAATAATMLFALASCSTTNTNTISPYQQPNQLMSNEINQRIEQIPFQHREELVQNLMWLAQTGEQTIPALLQGLNSDNPKVRSSCCWVLGRLRDRRTVPTLQGLTRDSETSVRMEASRSLVLMGDIEQAPNLIEGLDSDRKEVRYMCHEALKSATGHDFGYDHLNQEDSELRFAVLRWRQWWGEYSGDQFFAQSYEKKHGLNNLAAPGGETKPQGDDAPKSGTPEPKTPETNTPETSGSSNTSGTGGNSSQSPSGESSSTEGTETSTPGIESPSTGGASSGTNGTQSSSTEVPTVEIPAAGAGSSTGTPAKPSTPVIKPPVVDAPKPGTSGQTTGATGATGTNGGN